MRLSAVALMGLYGLGLLLHPSSSAYLANDHKRKVSASPAAANMCDSGSSGNSTTSDCLYDISTFGTSLFAALSEGSPGGNVLVSPLSVAQALALLAAGATPSSRCEHQLLAALGVRSHEDVPRLTESLLSSAAGADNGGVSLASANSVWLAGDGDGDDGVGVGSIKPEYAEVARSVHSSAAFPLPATHAPMNEWVANATSGLITDLFDSAEPLDPLVRAYLLNAVYFKGSWTDRFDVAKTEIGTFRGSGTRGDISPVKFMKDMRRVMVGRAEGLGGATVVELTYGEVGQDENGFDVPPDFSALFVLPADEFAEAMGAAVSGMTEQSLAEIMWNMYPREVRLSLPKFKLEWGATSLRDALRALGVNDAFDGSGVLSGMSDDPELHLDDALHKAVMEISEEGTVAAAATGMKISTRSMPPPPLDVKFDRPFLVTVVHKPTGTPIFLGRMEDPALSFDSVE